MEHSIIQAIETDHLIKVLVALAVGGLLGLEREYRNKAAGMRTLTLICLGSTLFTILSVEMGYPSSPDRVASNILTGVGFIGAGVIFKGEYSIDGITTAATIWVTAALGIAIGLAHYQLTIFSLIVVLLLLVGLKALEARISSIREKRIFTIAYQIDKCSPAEVIALFNRFQLQYKQLIQTREDSLIEDKFEISGKLKSIDAIHDFLLKDRNIQRFSVQSNPL